MVSIILHPFHNIKPTHFREKHQLSQTLKSPSIQKARFSAEDDQEKAENREREGKDTSKEKKSTLSLLNPGSNIQMP
jgi:hypothetical protein